MNPNDRIDLKKLMKLGENDYVDNTDGIRRLKHSDLIVADMKKMIALKSEHASMRERNPIEFSALCQSKCSFLYNAYTDIYNRLYKDELDVELMLEALKTLKQIEDGKINQQEGSIIMGKLFYKVFVSNAIKHEEKVNETLDSNDVVDTDVSNNPVHNMNEGIKMSWKDYKRDVLKQTDEPLPKPPQKKKKPVPKKKK
jgi:regulator of sigma D